MKIAVIDYGSGNLRSVAKAIERAMADASINGQVIITSELVHIRNSDRIVLPGVGAFNDCHAGIKSIPGLWQSLNDAVKTQGKPLLGICVGMQLLADWGREFGDTEGFGWIGGEVKLIEFENKALNIPHMGWNNLFFSDRRHPLFEGILPGAHVYFVHSYAFQCANVAYQIASVDYGGHITASIGHENVVGSQFHPEKSQAVGLRFLTNFLKWQP